ncbi:glucans biosynthesis glucosyltransferase MdoH [Halothiobacillus sp.]|uniref:glucans biosynthesis glucosyltransferase MdoH n=1 Tax=Halothiobacillus sp. TaxID=1891311 RepID=UPI002AD41CAB|nr:glucans biosynthesis glucosyltransferase MdoH [Halothiobacillus sp.]
MNTKIAHDPFLRTALIRRWMFMLLIMTQTAFGVWGMIWVLPYHGSPAIEQAILATFIPLYAFVAAGSWMALFGFYIRRRYGGRGDANSLLARFGDQLPSVELATTAVALPIYHEDVERVFRGLQATIESVLATGQGSAFEFFVLSDSRDPEVWLEERAAWLRLCEVLDLHGRLHYRRRRVNLKAKTGNVSDFLRRWGKKFKYFIVLDADSVMSGQAIVTLVRLMECEPKAGMIQTVPKLFNARSAFARMQQFVTHLYGPLFSEGLAALQLNEAVFWGHNAIIRTEAFMAHCGLRSMRGLGLWRGTVLSHDFVEASFIRRAGYEVWLETGIEGSYEESPPSLDDELIRDKRWSKGNLQHLRFLGFERGIATAHRMAFLNGIFAYLASPVWFLFLLFSTIEVAQFAAGDINYFPDAHSLYPNWPQWHPQWAIILVTSTLVTLFLPKLLALFELLIFDRKRLPGFGSTGRLLQGFLLENMFSILLAPIRMLAHSAYVVQAVINVSVAWAGQNRSSEIGWGQAFIRHAPGMILALTWSGIALSLDANFFYWTIPISLSLLLAAPITVWLSRFTLGDYWRDQGIWSTPPEQGLGCPVLVQFSAIDMPALKPTNAPGWLEWTLLHPNQARIAAALAAHRTGAAKQASTDLGARILSEGLDLIPRRQAARVLDDADAVMRIHQHAWQAPPDDVWGRTIDTLTRSICVR